MKNVLTIVSTLIIGSVLTLTACGKDKKPATTDPAMGSAASEPAKTDPAAGSAKPDDKKAEDPKPAGGGW